MINEKIPFAAAALLCVLTAAPSQAQQKPKLPNNVTFTAYDTGTAGFNTVVVVGKMMDDKYKATTRVLAAGNDLARLGPVKLGRATASGMGSGTYFAQEGVFEFAAADWGPQQVRIMLGTSGCNGAHLAVAKDTGVKEMKDLKGKRVGFVVGGPALNQNSLALLAFGGLTKNDVQIVEFSSYNAMSAGLVNNEIDAAFAVTIARAARELETSPRGLVWPPMPHSDAAGWERVKAVAPYYTKQMATCGAGGLSPQKPMELGVYPYPLFTTYANHPADTIEAVTAAMIEGFDAYKDAAPGAEGLAADRQDRRWAVPYHDGAIKALKAAGFWNDGDQAHNDALVKRQDLLAKTWKDFTASTKLQGEAFEAEWMKVRSAALKAEKMSDDFAR
jgi:TRAP transporter TAXI family solute receptor